MIKKSVAAIVLAAIFLILVPSSQVFAAEEEINLEELHEVAREAVEAEDGSVFEKILGKTLAGIGTAIKSFSYKILGFRSLDTLVFNKGTTISGSLFSNEWQGTMRTWYNRMRAIIFPLVLLAVITTAFRFFRAAKNPRAREEAFDAVLRLFFSSVIILFAPVFVNTLVKLNNYLVDSISALLDNGSVDKAVGLSPSMLDNIKTGSPILTGVVILMLAGIELRINIMFFMRMFTITVLYIFTPFVAALWAIEKSVNAAGIWLGEMISNIFMQFAYAFVFMIFLVFVPYMGVGGTLISVMVIISVAEMIRNSVQNLWTRLSGLDEAGTSFKIAGALGAIAAIPTLGRTIAAQFGGLSTARTAVSRMFGGRGGSQAGAAVTDRSSGIADMSGGDGGGIGGGTAVSAGVMGSAAGPSVNSGVSDSAPGTRRPAMGGSINNAKANAVTGLGVGQTLSNIAQFAIQTGATIAMLPFGETGQRIASSLGYAAGAAARTAAAPIALTGSAVVTGIKQKEGIKGIRRAYRESLGIRDEQKGKIARGAWRTVSTTARYAFGGAQSGIDAVRHYGRDPLDGMRYF